MTARVGTLAALLVFGASLATGSAGGAVLAAQAPPSGHRPAAGGAALAARASSAGDRSPSERASEVVALLELAVTEYRDAVDGGRIINQAEYEEARQFTAEATRLFRELVSGTGAGDGAAAEGASTGVSARLDSLAAMVERRAPVPEYGAAAERIARTLARDWGAVAVPEPVRRPSAARGAALYRAHCAACHGASGRGDGPAGEGLEPPAADLTAPIRRQEATPARDFQVVSLGVPATAMPAFADTLGVSARWDLTAYLQGLRFDAARVAEGHALALEGPVPEAGASAGAPAGASPLAGSVRLWADPSTSARWTDAELASRVRARWESATGGPLDEERALSVVAYLRSLAGAPLEGVPEADRSQRFAERIDRSDSLLLAAAEAATAGRADEARRAALAAYMEFEAVEPGLRARAPDLATRVESDFGRFREAVAAVSAGSGSGDAGTERGSPGSEPPGVEGNRTGGAAAAAGEEATAAAAGEEATAATPPTEAALAAVRQGLEAAREELTSEIGAWSLATQSAVIILREGFEAILIIGAILAFLVKTGHRERRRDVHLGVAAALAASVGTAILFEAVLTVTPASREVLEGVTMLLAVVVLFSVSYWLLSKLEHRKWEAYLRTRMRRALGAGGGLALAGVAFLAVYREGFETILFYQALLGFSESALGPVAAGFVAGSAVLAVLYLLFMRFGVRIPIRPFFAVTSGVLYYMAVVFAGKGVRELQEGGVLSTTPVAGAPRLELMGVYPTVETLLAQGVLVALLVGALLVTFGLGSRAGSGAGTRSGVGVAEGGGTG